MADDLTKKQRTALAALVGGASIADAAAACGVHRNTVSRWLTEHAFGHALIAAQDDALNMAALGAAADLATALASLRDVLDNSEATPALRLRAATALIDARLRVLETASFTRRLSRLEEMLAEVINARR